MPNPITRLLNFFLIQKIWKDLFPFGEMHHLFRYRDSITVTGRDRIFFIFFSFFVLIWLFSQLSRTYRNHHILYGGDSYTSHWISSHLCVGLDLGLTLIWPLESSPQCTSFCWLVWDHCFYLHPNFPKIKTYIPLFLLLSLSCFFPLSCLSSLSLFLWS